MDTLETYREIIRKLLQQYTEVKTSKSTVKAEVIIDPVKDHYQLLYIGWDGSRRVHDIAVLWFRAPNVRQFTGYAIA